MILMFSNKVIIHLILLVVFSAISTINYHNAGVKPGDWMVHSLVYTGRYHPEPFPYIIKRTVLSVNGNEVILKYTALWTNGTLEEKIVSGDISRGAEYISPVLIPPNLGVNDCLYLKITENFRLNIFIENEDKVTINLQNNTLERILVSARFSIGQSPWPLINVTAFWDKATGILVFMHSQHERFNSTCRLLDTNVFMRSEDEEPFQLSYPLVVTAATISVFVVLTTYAILKPVKRRK